METTKKCTKCNEFKLVSEFYKESSKKDGLRSNCKQCIKQYNKEYNQSHKNENLERNKRYNQTHKIEIAEYKKQYAKSYKNERNENERLKRQNNAQYRLIINLRSRLNQCIKNKRQTTKELIGIPFDIFMNWIEFQIPSGYSLDDLGKNLHIDHVIPLSSFDLTDESQLKKAMSWINLQPLEASKNISKSNSNNPWLMVCQEAKAKYFIKQNNNK